MFLRMLTLADPSPNAVEWTCPWPETFSVAIGNILVVCICLIAITILHLLSANGHLMGQDYLVAEPMQRLLGINLEELDPDGDDMIRFEIKTVTLTHGSAARF